MKTRTLGKTNIKISEIGLGTWQLGSADWGVISDREALAILHRAVDRGVTLFDTADVYGLGVSERIIGKFLKATRQKVHVSTKLGRVFWAKHGWPKMFTLKMVRAATQQSLKNLGVDAIFLQQWHCIPTPMLRDGEALDHLETLRREGLIQHWGASVESVEEALLCMTHPGCAALQVIYNIFRQKLTDELLPVAKRCNVGILARVPLASGLLTGRFKHGHRFPQKDHRHYNRDGQAFNVGETFAGVPFEKGVDYAARIKTILKPTGDVPMAQLALRWILDHDAVSAVIPGATRLEHIDSNAAASRRKPLSAARHAALRTLYDKKIAPTVRGPY
ncbi:aldo/keto reductase [bacterium]|nr:aldo/keto reductase [bacterium]